MAHGKVKLSVMVDIKTADEIDRISKYWNMSLSDTSGGKAMSKIELTEIEKDRLIKILKEVNEIKDQFLDKLTSDLVFANRRIQEDDKIFQQIKDMTC